MYTLLLCWETEQREPATNVGKVSLFGGGGEGLTCWTWIHFEHVRVNVGRLELVGVEESQVGLPEARHGKVDGPAVFPDFESRVRDEEADGEPLVRRLL